MRLADIQNVYLYPATKNLRTNEVMLTYRTCMHDLNLPFVKESQPDEAAIALRDKLMPMRSLIFHKHCCWLLRANRVLLQSSIFGCPGIVDFVGLRTLWLDDLLLRAVRQGCTQVVVIAAGFCTRAQRMAASGKLPPGVSFYEIDLPSASSQKRELMGQVQQKIKSPVPSIEYIPADLSVESLDDVLLPPSPCKGQAKDSPASKPPPFDPQARTLFTAEGLTYYLPMHAVEGLFRKISQLSAPGSLVGFDALNADVHKGLKDAPGYHTLKLTVQNKGEKLLSGLPSKPEDLAQLLSLCGLQLMTLYDAKGLSKQFSGAQTDCKKKSKGVKLPPFFRYIEAQK